MNKNIVLFVEQSTNGMMSIWMFLMLCLLLFFVGMILFLMKTLYGKDSIIWISKA